MDTPTLLNIPLDVGKDACYDKCQGLGAACAPAPDTPRTMNGSNASAAPAPPEVDCCDALTTEGALGNQIAAVGGPEGLCVRCNH